MASPQAEATCERPDNRTLINEAIERILLDVVIRGHGERLIGRWSSESSVQQFLERVPYLLDRINQLHLICVRGCGCGCGGSDGQEPGEHLHSHHRHHRPRRHQADWEADSAAATCGASPGCLRDFVGLVGAEHHWLVRTRDSLGLTPLHKAVLFNNRPIAEFILDRYPDELAPIVGGGGGGAQWSRQRGAANGQQRLIDAQDKYGRSALHYAAVGPAATSAHDQPPLEPLASSHQQRHHLSLFKLLLARGADGQLRDFRGKTAHFYARHPSELRARSIVHLANKLNANHQAAVLSRSLKALDFRGERPLNFNLKPDPDSDSNGDRAPDDAERERTTRAAAGQQNCAPGDHSETGAELPGANRESMSLSCADLSCRKPSERPPLGLKSSAKSCSTADLSQGAEQLIGSTAGVFGTSAQQEASEKRSKRQPQQRNRKQQQQQHRKHQPFEAELRLLASERLERPILDERTRARVTRCLQEAKLEAINQLVVEGLGGLVLERARLACWNGACKRYIESVIPKLLKQLDALHELVASNRLLALRALLAGEPVLARIRRPYRRAALNALHLAVQLNRERIARFLLERFPELLNQLDSHGATCLHWAARSLHSERLYNWLSDHFGAQLERVRDQRGNTAADYRRQAIRLASFELGQRATFDPAAATTGVRTCLQTNPAGGEVERLLQRTQTQRDELRASGVSSRLHRRPPDRKPTQVAAPTAGKPRPRAERAPAPPHRMAATPADLQEEVHEDGPPPPEKRPDQRAPVVRDGLEAALASLEPKEREQPESSPSAATRAESDANDRKGSSASSTPSKADESAAADELRLLEEFGQLDAAELADESGATPAAADGDDDDDDGDGDGDGDGDDDGPKIDHTHASGPEEPANHARDHSAARRRERNMSQMIRDCIAANQLKRLQHLILAGCGRRVLQVYRSLAADERRKLVSRQMGAYLEGRALEVMETCEQIHAQLHHCHTRTLRASQLEAAPTDHKGDGDDWAPQLAGLGGEVSRHKLELATELEAGAKKGDNPEAAPGGRETLNASFHKLSSLLRDNSFVMARDQFGASPLHVALVRSHGRLLDYLLRRLPSAASAPDHDNRTALHYAAIVLAAYERHGPLKLARAAAAAAPACAPHAYWQVDATARQVYERLRARFGHELAGLRDRKAKRAADYLAPPEVPANRATGPELHWPLERLPRGLYRAELIGRCCGEYAEMLRRYEYCILVAGDDDDDDDDEPRSRADSLDDCEAAAQQRESRSEPITRPPSPLVDARQQQPQPQPQRHSNSFESNNRRLRRQEASCCERKGSASSEPAGASATAAQGAAQACEQEEAELGALPNRLATKAPAGQLDEPAVSGSDLSRAPTSGLQSGARKQPRPRRHHERRPQQTRAKRLLNSSAREEAAAALNFSSPLLIPQPAAAAAAAAATLLSGAGAADQTGAGRRASKHKRRHHSGRLSVVGGVIVPTIIHNDRMDEIETYDIIYRRPLSRCSSSSSSSSGSSSSSSSACSSVSLNGSLAVSNTSLNSAPLSLDGRASPAEQRQRHRRKQTRARLLAPSASTLIRSPPVGSSRSRALSPTIGRHPVKRSHQFGCLNGEIEGAAGAPANERQFEEHERELELELDGEQSEANDPDDAEEDRVGRLSDEFEDRVRREKSELRQKVDQIMREIKLSAKSGKSSRFLASPNDLAAPGEFRSEPTTGQTNGRQQLNVHATTLPGQQLLQAGRAGQMGAAAPTLETGPCKMKSPAAAAPFESSTSTAATCSDSQCNSSSTASGSSCSRLSAGEAHARTSSCSSASSTTSSATISSVSSPTNSLGGGLARARPNAGKRVTISGQQQPPLPLPLPPPAPPLSQPLLLAQQAQKSQQPTLGGQQHHLSELTSQLVSKNTYGQTYLHFIASKSQSSSALYKVVEHASHLIGERDVFYRTARDVALQFSLTNNAQVLDKFIIDLFIGNRSQLLWRLLQQGYSPLIHVSDPDGNDIMLILKLLKQERMIHQLLQMADFQRWRDELHTFIRHGYSAGVSELIRRHRDLVGAKSAYARTSLHLAVLFDRADMAAQLIAADPTSVRSLDNMGRTPLHYVYGLHLKDGEHLRDLLLKHGASVEARDVRERTPKYYYIFRREIEEIRRIELELN